MSKVKCSIELIIKQFFVDFLDLSFFYDLKITWKIITNSRLLSMPITNVNQLFAIFSLRHQIKITLCPLKQIWNFESLYFVQYFSLSERRLDKVVFTSEVTSNTSFWTPLFGRLSLLLIPFEGGLTQNGLDKLRRSPPPKCIHNFRR